MGYTFPFAVSPQPEENPGAEAHCLCVRPCACHGLDQDLVEAVTLSVFRRNEGIPR